ncbi:MAG: Gfo/Idh/MocA family oxidoreductase [Gemmatimonadota bacterium]
MNRRDFVKHGAVTGVGVATFGLPRVGQRRDRVDTVNVAVMGVNSRGLALAESFAGDGGAEVVAVCDVDVRAMEACITSVAERQARAPRAVGDFRRTLDDPDVDALVIASPDHWHMPAALLALKAGKHVYLEKPCSHNPREGELIVEAQAKYGGLVQMGNQQRSAPESIEVISEIHAGLIGRAYFARAWYANTRGSIGRGRETAVPEWLDYELWQGPAPRTPYRDNVVHYNWHWFWRWGTGEICNNGTHEIDVARWALGVDLPLRVTSTGGRYHFRDDGWKDMPDTQLATFEFEDGKMLTWQGKSCNGRMVEGRGRGVAVHGEKGTVVIDRAGYVVYDEDNRQRLVSIQTGSESTLDTRGGGNLTDLHIENFLASVRGESTPTAPVDEGATSQLLCHLGNIAWRKSRDLKVDPTSGQVVGDEDAMGLWGREYEPGWEPRV